MSQALKLAMLFALVLFAAPFTASAHPAFLGGGLASQAATPIVKAGCYYGECEEEVYIRRRCWHGCDDYRGDWRRHDCGYGGCGHSRYYSHYRWGSYQRYWRPNWCCGGHSGWGD